jgi:hypothetical protein
MADSTALVSKQDVIVAIAHILIRLGKNDFDGTEHQFRIARQKFRQWLQDRPEKMELETADD